MADNSATALAFGSTGLLNLLQFVTTDAGAMMRVGVKAAASCAMAERQMIVLPVPGEFATRAR
jgi:hypothetical protein